MALYRVRRPADATTGTSVQHGGVLLVVGVLLVAVIVPLWSNSEHFDQSNIQLTGVQAVADHWASGAGWSVLGVSNAGQKVLIDTTGPSPSPRLSKLRQGLDAAGLGSVDVRVHAVTERYAPVPG